MKKNTALSLDEDVYEWLGDGFNRSGKANAALRSVMTKNPLSYTKKGRKELKKLI